MTGTRARLSFNPLRINSGTGRGQYLRVGRELLCPGSDQALRAGGFWWHVAGGTDAQQLVVRVIEPRNISKPDIRLSHRLYAYFL
jgi:hypothetical protein